MSDSQPQSLAHHAKFVPLFHFALFGALVINVLWAAASIFISPVPIYYSLWHLVMAVALVGLAWFSRTFPLGVQDRLIRLEETLRMQRLLPADLQSRLGELRLRQFIALRFASDAELADRVREALDQKLGSAEIKKRIQSWRADHCRI